MCRAQYTRAAAPPRRGLEAFDLSALAEAVLVPTLTAAAASYLPR